MAGEEQGQSIGAARVDIVVDLDAYAAEIDRAKNLAAGLGADFEASFQKMDRASKRSTTEALLLSKTWGKNADEIKLLTLAARGAAPEALEELRKSMERTRLEAVKGGAQLSAYGMSAKQTAAALRGVPAQVTDIFTSLAGGQKPLTVLLQQGGQLKDMFGGIRPAAAALGGALLNLVNPLTLTAAGVGTLLLAFQQRQGEDFGFTKALIATGNYADVTRARLDQLIETLDRVDGISSGGASEAFLKVAESGRFTGEQFALVATAAARMEVATGQSIDKTVEKFESIAKKPIEALLKLNETEHFLTDAQYDRIKALEEEGQFQTAAAEAIGIYADQLDRVATQTDLAMPALSKAWRDLKDDIGGAWNEVKGFAEFLAQTGAKVKADSPTTGFGFLLAGPSLRDLYKAARTAEPAAAGPPEVARTPDAVDSEDMRERAKLLKEFAADEAHYLDDSAKKIKEKTEVQKLLTRGIIDQAKATERLALIDKYYADKASKRGSKTNADDNAAKGVVETVERQIDANNLLAATGDKVSASDRLAIKVRQLLGDTTNTMTKATRALLEARLPELEASDRAAEAMQRETKAAEALSRQRAILEQQASNRRSSNESELMGFGRSDEAVAQVSRQIDIQREYADELKRLGDRSVADDQATWDALAANARAHRDQMLREEQDFQLNRALAMGSWQNGASKALEDYLAESRDVAAQYESLFTDAFNGAEDALVKFVQTGKLSFRDLASSVIADMARIQIRGLASGLLGLLSGGGGSSGLAAAIGFSPGSGLAAASGAAFDTGGVRAFARGGTFTNKIVSSPTRFRFGGRIGEMGEAGPEAIMPLTRTSGGRLGVAAVGGGSPNITIENHGTSKSWEVQQLSENDVRIIARDEVSTKAPGVIAAELENPNSRVSKSMSRNTTAGRQRF